MNNTFISGLELISKCQRERFLNAEFNRNVEINGSLLVNAIFIFFFVFLHFGKPKIGHTSYSRGGSR